MAFTKDTFIPGSAMANSSAGRLFSYRSATDNLVAVKAASYFDDAAQGASGGGMGLRSGDFILVDATDGQSFLFVGVNPANGVVTVGSANDFA